MDTSTPVHPDHEIWFLTGSQGLYGEDVLRQVADQSRSISETLGRPGKVPVRIVWKPVLTDAESIRRMCQEASASDT
ncbi:L-arabinose isomerase, partial [Streptomyces sp. NPDC005760]